jgi:hypothetical protein
MAHVDCPAVSTVLMCQRILIAAQPWRQQWADAQKPGTD